MRVNQLLTNKYLLKFLKKIKLKTYLYLRYTFKYCRKEINDSFF